MWTHRLLAIWGGLCLANLSSAGELLPPERPIQAAIDHYVDALLKQERVVPAPPADDTTLIRRLSLDLAGRIPSPAEIRAYVESTDPAKKTHLVDRLLETQAFLRHQSVMFDAMLSPANNATGLREYLQRALGENRPWNQIFRELLVPDESDPKQKGASDFLKGRLMDLDKLTIDVSVSFFGVNVSCAQCHDHPLVSDWKQDHFYGMKTFFSRTYASGGFVGERDYGLIRFKPNNGAEREARPIFLTGQPIDLPNLREPTSDELKKEKEQKGKGKAKEGQPPPAPPTVSARARLVEAALQPGNSGFFDKSIVNRLWHRFMGFGLVNPLDQMHSENPPSHPELLNWLARDLSSHQYDMRRLIRGIVLSQTYARSSKYDLADQPSPRLFAVARLKPLLPLQLATSLKIATVDPATLENLRPEELETKLDQLERSGREFASQIALPTSDDFQIGVNEALLFSNNGKMMQEFLGDAAGTLLGRVKADSDPKQAVGLIVQTVFGRPASPDESRTLVEYVQKRSDRPVDAYRQIIWALISSSEFRFNY